VSVSVAEIRFQFETRNLTPFLVHCPLLTDEPPRSGAVVSLLMYLKI
jgi:hypothetical protein